MPPTVQLPADGFSHMVAALAAGVLAVNGDGMVAFANTDAAAFFAPLHPVGTGFAALLGLSDVSNGGELVAATRAGVSSAPIRIGLPDGRMLDGRSRPLDGGGAVVTLLDVSGYVNAQDSTGRDPLTGLANGGAPREHLARLLAPPAAVRSPVAVVCLELDRFKMLHDTLGYPAGDTLLVKIADRLRNALRRGDMAARIGANEFAIIQTEAPQPRGASTLVQRLLDLLGRPFIVEGQAVSIGASAGVAISPADGEDADTLLKHAGLALNRARTDGRGLFRFYHARMDDEVQSRRMVETDLRRALALNQFDLAYQPR